MAEKHEHTSKLDVECDKCGGEAKVLTAVYPKSYECVCTKCKHRFVWIEPEEK